MDLTNVHTTGDGMQKSVELLFCLPPRKAAEVLKDIPQHRLCSLGVHLYQYYEQHYHTQSAHSPKQNTSDNAEAQILYRQVEQPQQALLWVKDLYTLAFGKKKGEAQTHKIVRALFSQKFDFLRSYTATQIYQATQHESEQLLALLFLCLDSHQSGALLALCSPERRRDIVKAIIHMQAPNPEILESVKAMLNQRLIQIAATQPRQEQPEASGTKTLTHILSHLSPSMRTTMLAYLDDDEIKRQIQKDAFSWKELHTIPVREREALLKPYSMRDLALILLNEEQQAADFITEGLSTSNRALLEEEMQLLRTLPPNKIDTVQQTRLSLSFIELCQNALQATLQDTAPKTPHTYTVSKTIKTTETEKRKAEDIYG